MSILSCSAKNCERQHSAKGYCKMHYQRWRKSGTAELHLPLIACQHCGTDFEQKKNAPFAKYCSRRCGQKAYWAANGESICARQAAENAAKPPNSIRCVQYGGLFESKRRAPKFCSTTCNNRWRDEHNEARCSEACCGRGVRAKGLCAMHWRRNARAEGREAPDQWNERRKANYQKRRALKLQLPADDIRPIDVYERDGWVCGICSEAVEPGLSWPDPMSPSLDHVMPLSLGGHHVMENVALAHLSCNVRKGNRVEAGVVSA